ncbi:MAG: CZB domain-containing protein [Sulfurimonadaceae bacterium]|nr:CZB domain-containing protein [Sulfurimonadaceae bacterium]
MSIEKSTFITLTKIDHIIFKTNIYDAVYKRKPQEKISDHHSCRLGVWYEHGKGKEQFGTTKGYESIVAPHERVHNAAMDVMKTFGEEERNLILYKEDILKQFTNMEESSKELFTIMDEMLREAVSDAHKVVKQ